MLWSTKLAVAVGGLAFVVDRWGRARVRRSRSGSDHQHNLQLLADGGGAKRARPGSCQVVRHGPGGAMLAPHIPRLACGSAPADSPAGAKHARDSAVHWNCRAGRQHLQQLLSGLGTSFCCLARPDVRPPALGIPAEAIQGLRYTIRASEETIPNETEKI